MSPVKSHATLPVTLPVTFPAKVVALAVHSKCKSLNLTVLVPTSETLVVA